MSIKTINRSEPIYTPFVRARDSVWEVMSDVLLALVPCAVISYFAYGEAPFLVMFIAVISAVVAELFFAWFFLKKKDTLKDGSAIVTAILLAFTLALLLLGILLLLGRLWLLFSEKSFGAG